MEMQVGKRKLMIVCATSTPRVKSTHNQYPQGKTKDDLARYVQVFDAKYGSEYRCKLCPKIYAWKQSVVKHWNAKHAANRTYRAGSTADDSELSNKENKNRDSNRNQEVTVQISSSLSNKTAKQCLKTSKSEIPEDMNGTFLKTQYSNLMQKVAGQFVDDSQISGSMQKGTVCIDNIKINSASSHETLDIKDERDTTTGCHDSGMPKMITSIVDHSQTEETLPIPKNDQENLIVCPLQNNETLFEKNLLSFNMDFKNNRSVSPIKKCKLSETECPSNIVDDCFTSDYLNSGSNSPIESTKSDKDPVLKLQITNIQTLSSGSSDTFAQPYSILQTSNLNQQSYFKKEHLEKDLSCSDITWRYKCPLCPYRARWLSEMTRHAQNHSDEKPFGCPRCMYKSKWKWDVLKHYKKCGERGLASKYVIDERKQDKKQKSPPYFSLFSKETIDHPSTVVHPTETTGVSFLHITNDKFAKQSSSLPKNFNIVKSLDATSFHCDRSSTSNCSLEFQENSVYSDSDFSDSDISVTCDFNEDQPMQHNETTYRSLVNEELHHCLECPFIGYNILELENHTALHADTEALTCDMCGFCTKDKSELTKHVERYKHYSSTPIQPDHLSTQSSTNNTKKNSDPYYVLRQYLTTTNSFQGVAQSSFSSTQTLPSTMESGIISRDTHEDKLCKSTTISTVETVSIVEDSSPKFPYQCLYCDHITYKKHVHLSHMNIHRKILTTAPHESPSVDKLICNKCPYIARDLPAFLQHNLAHTCSTGENTSNKTIISDSPALKCGRVGDNSFRISPDSSAGKDKGNTIKLFSCPKCPYLCYKKSTLERHCSRHGPRGLKTVKCQYCDYNVKYKKLILQHMKLHKNCEFNDRVEVGESSPDTSETSRHCPGNAVLKEEVSQNTDVRPWNYPDTVPFHLGEESSNIEVTPKDSSGTGNEVFGEEESRNTDITSREFPVIEVLGEEGELGQVSYRLEYRCDWCNVVLPNVALLYHHAQAVHREELLNQETEMNNEVGGSDNNISEIVYADSCDQYLGENMVLTKEIHLDKPERSLKTLLNMEEKMIADCETF